MSQCILVGIYLGGTNSYIAFPKFVDDEIITDNLVFEKIPSIVCFTDTDQLVGDEAKIQSAMYMESTIYDSKRLIGRSYDDANVRSDSKNWPFEVIECEDRLKIQIKRNDKNESFFPEEISGMILSKLKQVAEERTKMKVVSAVITVPAYYNDAQRQAIVVAASLAGLKVLKIVNEHTAAAIAYGATKRDDKERFVLIFDLGGGTFDVSILKIYNEKIKVLATGGDNHLGGVDFDTTLLEYCITYFKNKNKIDIRECKEESRKAIARLRDACELAKITLSTSIDAKIQIDNLYKGHDLDVTIMKSRFESLNKKSFDKCLEIVDLCIKNAKKELGSNKPDIILVGGSTRIPKIKELLGNKYDGQILKSDLNPDESVACGAAILADIIRERIPLSLGIEHTDGLMSVIIPRWTKIPTILTKTYSTAIDNQKSIFISVYEGERLLVEDNDLLAEIELEDIPRGNKGQVKFKVTFEIDIESNLSVTVSETSSNRKIMETVKYNRLKEDYSNVDKIIMEATRAKEKDDQLREAFQAKYMLLKYIETMKTILDGKSTSLTPVQVKKLSQDYEDAVEWTKYEVCNSKDKFIKKKKKLENTYMKI